MNAEKDKEFYVFFFISQRLRPLIINRPPSREHAGIITVVSTRYKAALLLAALLVILCKVKTLAS
ncbi:MAG: hypothetical protein ABIH42_01765 [Planctomycetota bacterium]